MRPPRVLLIFTPPSDPSQPYSSLPTLAAYLRLMGCEVAIADLNIEAVHHLLSLGELRRFQAEVAATLRQTEAIKALDAASADRYLRAVAASAANVCPSSVSTALQKLQQHQTYDSMSAFSDVMRVMDGAYRIVSSASYPAVLTRHKLDPGSSIWDPASLTGIVDAANGTPLNSWLRQRTRKLVTEHRPDLVGVSLTFPDQIPLAFVALSEVRQVDPDIHTCLGGVTATRLAARIERFGPLLKLVDSLVLGEGEKPLLELARLAASHTAPKLVESVIWRRGEELLKAPPAAPLHMDELPTPDYVAMPLGEYLVPEPVLLLNGSRACYWGRCNFCDVSGTASEPYRERSIDRVIGDIRRVRESCGARHIMFGDLAIAPARLEQLANRLIEEDLEVFWLCQARLEAGFTPERIRRLARGGCRGLVFGLESSSQSVLNRMIKGTRFLNTEPILRACGEAGISVNLQTFIGFPGETEEQARETVRFVVSQRRSITSVALTSFKLIEGTAAFEHAASLGLRELRQAQGTLDVLWSYRLDEGLQEEASDRLARELQDEIRRAFPAVEHGLSWNAHALLLTSRGGPESLRNGHAPAPGGAALRLNPEMRVVQLPYHVGELAQLVNHADPNRSLPGARQERLHAEPGAVARLPTWTVLDSQRACAIPLDRESSRLVQSCDGRSGARELLASAEDKPRAAALLLRLIDQGVLVPSPPACPEETFA